MLLGHLAQMVDVLCARAIRFDRQKIVQIADLGGIVFALIMNIGENQVSIEGLGAARKSFACVAFRFVEAV